MISDYRCRLCEKEYNNLISLAVHLSRTHHIKHEEYYNTYFKQEDEGYCVVCGKPTKYIKYSYANYCSKSCQFKDNESKMLATMKERYGSEYAAQSTICRQKMEQTCLDRYGVRSCLWTEESKKKALEAHTEDSRLRQKESTKKTCLDKYGVECTFQLDKCIINSHTEEANNKRKETCLDKYGVEIPFQSIEVREKAKQTLLDKYGVENPYQLEKVQINKNSPEARRKANITMRKNGHKSKAEDLLLDALDRHNIVYLTEYSSDKYPFNVDVYLVDYDMYIEVNIFPMHNDHFFDSTNKDDLEQLDMFKEKAKTSKWYKKLIEVWTVRDVEKQKYAITNNLKYIVIWTYDELNDFINKLKDLSIYS